MEPQTHSADETLKDIRNIMERSTRFTNFSGWSLIVPGIIAIAGWCLLAADVYGFKPLWNIAISLPRIPDYRISTCILAFILILSAVSAYISNNIKAKRNNQNLFDTSAKRAFYSFCMPLIFGGIFSAIVSVPHYDYGVLTESDIPFAHMLVFYGLALINASKYSLPQLRSLGIAQCVLSLLAALPLPFIGLLAWLLGFGFLNIIFGIIILRNHRA
jgi:hypothetical protein